MKLTQNDQVKATVTRIQALCKEFNPNIEKALSPFLLRFLIAVEQILTKEQWSELAAQLTSDRIKRKHKLEQLKKLLEKADDSDIAKFEAKIERKCIASNIDFQQKTADLC